MIDRKIFYKVIFKTLIVSIITILTLIIIKANPKLQKDIYYYLYEDSISFAKINKEYKKLFGSSIPFSDYFQNEEMVFNEKLEYQEISKYKDGAKLIVTSEYLVPNQDEGIVIFIGEKEGYGNTIIINQSNSIDVWYSNIDNISVNLYDYIEKGKYIGTAHNELYIVYKKDGKVLDYNEYL